MSRIGVIAAHVVALPVALVLAVLAAIPLSDAPSHAIDIHVRDTMFVVAHFHLTMILASAVIVVALVAGRYGSMNWLVSASGLLLIVHVISAVLLWTRRTGVPARADEFVVTPGPDLLLVYVASALACSCTMLLGLVASLWRRLRSKEVVAW